MARDKIFLEGLLSGEELDSAYRKRNRKYVYKRIVKQDLEPFFREGWEKVGRATRKHVRLKKIKDLGSGFEDEVWCTFYRMGFSEMNEGSNFVIPRFKTNLTKQIDGFCKDEQCIILIECKAAEKPHSRRQLGTEIDQLSAIRHELAESIYSHYKSQGITKKIKVVWILTLKNIDMSEKDLERAEKANIKVLDGIQVEYYSQLSKHFGRSSKYQFLADVLPGMVIPDLIDPVHAIKGKMGNTTFYSFLMEPEKLLKIAYIAHRGKTTDESMDTYQRMAIKPRLKKIAGYIHDKKGIFPTNIVINIETKKPLRFDSAEGMAGKNSKLGILHLPNVYKTAWIVDGQHRLFAYSDLEEAKSATLPVIAFENLDSDVQAQLFVDINGEQVKVPKNLLVDLYATLHWNSKNPKERLSALTSRLVKRLNKSPKSPFRDRIIKIGGRRTKTRTLTLTALVEEIKKTRLLGHVHSKKAKDITPGPLYQEDLNSTLERALDVISGYYMLYLENDKLKKQWGMGSGEGGYICTNQGIIATLRILKAILEHLEHKENVDVRKRNVNRLLEDVGKHITPVINYLANASPKTIKEFKERYGEGGYRSATFTLFKIIHDEIPKFDPQGLQDYIKQTDTSNNTEAYDCLMKLETSIHSHVVGTLKKQFGSDYSQWWHNGIKEKIRSGAILLASQQGEYKKYEKYLYLIDLKEIISDNWNLFSEIYTIDATHNDSRKKRLAWFTKINDIRNIVDHPPKGGVSDLQLEYVKRIYNEIEGRLNVNGK